LLARGTRAAYLREHGITLCDLSSGECYTTPIHLVNQLEPGDRYDQVITVVGKQYIPALLPSLATNPNVHNFLFVGNNAAGTAEYTRVLGKERVLFGFLSAAGTLSEQMVYFSASLDHTPARMVLGELDGQVTPRLLRIASVLHSAGFATDYSRDIDAWLKTHAALIVPLAGALYLCGCQLEHLAGTRDALVLYSRAVKELAAVLRKRQIAILPPRLGVMSRLPEPLFTYYLARRLGEPATRLGFLHAEKARDEMMHLAGELCDLAHQAGMPKRNFATLRAALDPQGPRLNLGSRKIPVDWHGIMLGGALLSALVIFIYSLNQRRLR
jgi:2-dehydropantoate 2-reductase